MYEAYFNARKEAEEWTALDREAMEGFASYTLPEFCWQIHSRTAAWNRMGERYSFPDVDEGLSPFEVALPSKAWAYKHLYGKDGNLLVKLKAVVKSSVGTVWFEPNANGRGFTRLVVGPLGKQDASNGSKMSHDAILGLVEFWIAIRQSVKIAVPKTNVIGQILQAYSMVKKKGAMKALDELLASIAAKEAVMQRALEVLDGEADVPCGLVQNLEED